MLKLPAQTLLCVKTLARIPRAVRYVLCYVLYVRL